MAEILNTTDQVPALGHPRYIEGEPENIETLERFTSGLQELQTDNPEIVGATLFGSRLKGEATAKSDVDCVIFIDAEQLRQAGVTTEINDKGSVNWGEHKELPDDFEVHFASVLADKTEKDPKTIKDGIYVRPISTDLINSHISMYAAYVHKYNEYLRQSAAHIDNPQAEIPEEPTQVFMSDSLSGLFSPDLLPGSKLDRYRQDVLKAIDSTGEYGEEIWKEIMSKVKFGEGHVDYDDPRYYPQNVQQAYEWYGADPNQGKG